MFRALALLPLVLSLTTATASPPVSPEDGFARADRPRDWSFPRDHASHPDFATEWWYFTGIVSDANGHDFGYELTFFRVALRSDEVRSTSQWRARDLLFAHFTLTDVERKKFYHEEVVQRAALDLAGADDRTFDVFIGDWQARWNAGSFTLRAHADEHAVELSMRPQKDEILHGEAGLSRKNADGTMASYYYSLPRLSTTGSMTVGDTSFEVTGTTWMDHEFFTGITPAGGLGWDWFSARLDDGRNLMLYRVRHPDGEQYDFGTLVEADGTAATVDTRDLDLTPTKFWDSPSTGSSYPVAWRVTLPAEDASIEVVTDVPQQEVVAQRSVGFAYWEGLCRYRGTWNGQPIRGRGYVELTGY